MGIVDVSEQCLTEQTLLGLFVVSTSNVLWFDKRSALPVTDSKCYNWIKGSCRRNRLLGMSVVH